MGEEIEHIIKLTGVVERLGGQLEVGFKNMENHITHVSKKADSIRDKLEAHEDSLDAHGAGAVQKSSNNAIAWIGVALGVISFAGPLLWAALKN